MRRSERSAPPPTREEKLAFLNAIVRLRGYTAPTHMLLANHDLDALKAYDPVPTGVYVEARRLDARLKELCLVAGFACLKGPRYALKTHMRKAAGIGIAPLMLLEALDLVVPVAGNAIMGEALSSWLEEFGEAALPPQDEGGDAMNSTALAKWGATIALLERHDPAIARRIATFLARICAEPRLLDERTRELLLIVVLVCQRAPADRLEYHIERATELGWESAEVLEALELLIPHAGLLAFEQGLNAWAKVTEAEPIEPEGAVFSRLD